MSDIPAALTEALAEHYRLDREIGAGGMATVYLAEDVKHHRKVAVKVLRPELSATMGPERFLREIEIAARLQHPHILPLYDSGQAGGFLYYVMPFVEGESLRARLARERELPVPEAARILRDIADALAHAHAMGVVHRDIKPENVLLSGRHALVTDFGVAKAVSEATGRQQLTTAGIALGTPTYMAPEQAAADPMMDHRADLYALGVVAYELLAGRPPFTGLSPQAVLAAHVTEAAEPVTRHRPQVPEALTSLVMRCLEKKPADRPQRADELLAVLETLQTPTLGITPTHTQPVVAAFAAPGRRRWALAAVIVAGLLGIGAGATMLARRGAATDEGRRLVLVMPFENRTGDPVLGELGELAASWIADAISRDGAAEAVPATTVRELLTEDSSAASRRVEVLARRTGARTAVVGEYQRRGDSVEFRASLVDGRSGRALLPVDPVRGMPRSADLLAALELRVIELVRNHFEFQGVSLSSVSRPTNLEAYREFVRGDEYFGRSQYREAARAYERVVAMDTGWIRPRIQLAGAYYNLGQRERPDSILRTIQSRRHTLAAGDIDYADWLQAWLTGDKVAEYRTGRRLFERAPRFAAYAVAVTALRTNRPGEVIAAARLRDTSTAWGREWFSWYSVQAGAHHLLGEHRRELAIVQERRRRDPLAQNALDLEIQARAAMGQAGEVTRLLDQSTSKPAGWLSGPGLAWSEFLAHGHDEAARAMLPRAVRVWEGYAAQPMATRADSVTYATALFWGRDYQRSREWWRRLAPGDTAALPLAARYLAFGAAALGQREEALRAGEAWAANPPRYCAGCASYYRSWIAALLGDRPRAVELLRQALSEGYPFSLGVHRSWAALGMRHERGIRELLRPKD